MEIIPIHKRVIGLDVHQNKISACVLAEQADGTVTMEHREFGGFKRDRCALAAWARGVAPDVVVMESTGIYWKSPYAALEKVGTRHRWSMPAMSRPFPVARPMWPTRSGWRLWRAQGWCAPRSFPRPTSVICA